ncbi:MAG: FtsX-like permease family protein [Alteromonadaceae bacterium]|nr:FtsX-like permease family protein [Alteromonadaceae bacterium]
MFEFGPIFNAMLRHKSHALLLVVQIALTLAIVAFIIQNRLDLMNRESGLPESEVFKFDIFTFGEDNNLPQQVALDEQLLRSLPGVIDAARLNQIPISGSSDNSSFSDKPRLEGSLEKNIGVYRGGTHTLNTLGVKLIEGRNFTDDEVISGDSKLPVTVAIVSKATVEAMFPLSPEDKKQGKQQQGLGKNLYAFDVPIKIIGIVEKLQRSQVNASEVELSIILPKISANKFGRYLVRTEANQRQEVMANIEKEMLKLYPYRVIRKPVTMNTLRDDSYSKDRMMSQLLTILIVILLLITSLGIVGMAVFNVNRRTRQIGTRRALGASKANIVRYFIIENWLVSTVGIVIGVGLSLLLNNFLMQQFSLPKLEPIYIVMTMLAIWFLGLIAVYLPAKKASHISPAIATRSV